MIIWGSGGAHAPIGAAGAAHCGNCNAVRSFNYGVDYRYAHIWYLFSWVTRRAYVRLCSVCESGTPVTRAEALASGGKEAIPFLRRWGWTIILAVVVAGVGLGIAGDADARKRVAEHVAHPHAGDIYLMDLANITDTFGGKHAYGLMKVVAVEADGVSAITSASAYERMSGARTDFNRHEYVASAYFDTDEKIELSSNQLSALRDAGAISDIQP
jgi:hypothetical protein